MSDVMHLVGAEDVRSAANTMSRAASEMTMAASSIHFALEQHQRFMDEWLGRLEVSFANPADVGILGLAALVQIDAVRARAHLQGAIAAGEGPRSDPSYRSPAELALEQALRSRGLMSEEVTRG